MDKQSKKHGNAININCLYTLNNAHLNFSLHQDTGVQLDSVLYKHSLYASWYSGLSSASKQDLASVK